MDSKRETQLYFNDIQTLYNKNECTMDQELTEAVA